MILLSLVGALTVLMVLSLSIMFHVTHWSLFLRHLASHQTVAGALVPFLAAGVVLIEIVVLTLIPVAYLEGTVPANRLASLIATTLFASYAAYTEFLRRTRVAAPCACFGDSSAVSRVTVMRNMALMLSAVATLWLPSSFDRLREQPAAQLVVALLAALALSILLSVLPAAIIQRGSPTGRRL